MRHYRYIIGIISYGAVTILMIKSRLKYMSDVTALEEIVNNKQRPYKSSQTFKKNLMCKTVDEKFKVFFYVNSYQNLINLSFQLLLMNTKTIN